MELSSQYLTKKNAYSTFPAKYSFLELKTKLVLQILFCEVSETSVQNCLMFLNEYSAGDLLYDLMLDLRKATLAGDYKCAIDLIERYVKQVDEFDFISLIKKSYLNRLAANPLTKTLIVTSFFLLSEFYGNGNLYGLLSGEYARVSVVEGTTLSIFDFMLLTLVSSCIDWLNAAWLVGLPSMDEVRKWFKQRDIAFGNSAIPSKLLTSNGSAIEALKCYIYVMANLTVSPLFYRSYSLFPVTSLIRDLDNLIFAMKPDDSRHKKVILASLLYRSIVPLDLLWFRKIFFSQVGAQFEFDQPINGWDSVNIAEFISETGDENYVQVRATDSKSNLVHTLLIPHSSFGTVINSLLYSNEIYLLNIVVVALGLSRKIEQIVNELTEEKLEQVLQQNVAFKKVLHSSTSELLQQLKDYVTNRILALESKFESGVTVQSVMLIDKVFAVMEADTNHYLVRETEQIEQRDTCLEEAAKEYYCLDTEGAPLSSVLLKKYQELQLKNKVEEEDVEVNSF